MVKVREDIPKNKDGTVDVNSWTSRILTPYLKSNDAVLLKALDVALKTCSDVKTRAGETCFSQGLQTAEILSSLDLELEVLAAAILYYPICYQCINLEDVESKVSKEVAKIVERVFSLNIANSDTVASENIDNIQKDNLRKMLLAMVKDPRVVMIKLAEHISNMRSVSSDNLEYRRELAEQANDIFAPLANRLGIGQIKWELEDLSFRYLNPIEYKSIAKKLDEKRLQRELYIKSVVEQIENALKLEGIQAEVIGRAKHIYSIYRKMKRKGIDFEQVYDIRAVRIMVPTITECYAALGVVHSLWQYISKEFDDYIASPKDNGYRSLHTAVVGLQGKVVEIQIRTYQMHKESELGLASHWAYKEGRASESCYKNKINSIKKIINWQDELGEKVNCVDTIAAFKEEVFNDTVYVYTPRGKVIALPEGATPIDFAYAIHTEVGHKCRGAKIDGKLVTLNYKLKSGQKVEIIKAKEGGPSRDWLNIHAAYVKSSRSKAKILQWFKQQGFSANVSSGKLALEKEFKRLGMENISLISLASKLKFKDVDDLCHALSVGELRITKVLQTLNLEREKEKDLPLEKIIHKTRTGKNDIVINGIDNLSYSIAKCCKPIPYEDIVGYIKIGQGISVHNIKCKNILKDGLKDKLLPVKWCKETIAKYFSADLVLRAEDRKGLLMDVISIMSKEEVNITATKTLSNHQKQEAKIVFTVELADLNRLRKVLTMLQQIPGVIEVRREVSLV